jgi:hypothetical protein
MRTAFAVSATLVVLAACSGPTVLEHVLTISISATTTEATVGEEMNFTFDVTGPIVVGIIIEYGDGVADSLELGAGIGVNAASGWFTHAFDTTATFLVEATVVDAQAGRLTDTLSVDITP